MSGQVKHFYLETPTEEPTKGMTEDSSANLIPNKGLREIKRWMILSLKMVSMVTHLVVDCLRNFERPRPTNRQL